MIALSIILVVTLALIFLFLITALPTSSIYMFIFEHNEWKMWRFFQKNVFKFRYEGFLYEAHRFTFEDYDAYVWNGYSSVHHETKGCVCSPFWEAKSKRFGMELMKLKEEK